MKIDVDLAGNALVRIFNARASIVEQVDAWAVENEKPTYSSSPKNYSFRNPGLVGFPPKVSINVYFVKDGQTIDMGKIVAR
jgi:hypothetical protein